MILLCSARLFPLKKNNGKPALLPSATPSASSSRRWPSPPHQGAHGVHAPSADRLAGTTMCEQVALSLHAILASNPCLGKWAVLQVNIRNAFNTVHRSAVTAKSWREPWGRSDGVLDGHREEQRAQRGTLLPSLCAPYHGFPEVQGGGLQ